MREKLTEEEFNRLIEDGIEFRKSLDAARKYGPRKEDSVVQRLERVEGLLQQILIQLERLQSQREE
jgi:hypothetical protein